MAIKTGPLTRDELMQLWASVTDREYNRPLLEKEGSNVEVIEQAAEQLAAVSRQVDENTQGLFILPWSGQTASPSVGAQPSRVVLKATRDGLFTLPLFISAGDIVVQHRLNDYGPNGPQDVTTNRLFVVEESVAFGVGQAGPIDVKVVATTTGPGFNEVEPGTLRTILQPGVGFSNTGATVENGGGATNRLVCTVFPDVPITQHVGQYLLFTSGANAGQYRRIVGVGNPNPAIPHGGTFDLSAELILAVTGVTGTFSFGERVTQPLSTAEGIFVSLFNGKMVIIRSKGSFDGTNPIEGEFGGTATVVAKEQSETLTAEIGTAGWRVVSWSETLHLSLTNEEYPTGGACGFLDELGNERGLPRFTGESDDVYRKRIAVPADVVSPGAVTRAANKILEPLGFGACVREVGRDLLPGIFFDGAPSQKAFAYDLDLVEMTLMAGDEFLAGERVSATDVDGLITTGQAQYDTTVGTTTLTFTGVVNVRGPGFAPGQILKGLVSGVEREITTVGPGLFPQYRFFVLLSLREFRGFFIVGVPRLRLNDFGLFYDYGPNNAFDTKQLLNFYDGAALGTESVYSQIWKAVDAVRPAGIPFDMYIEDFGCF